MNEIATGATLGTQQDALSTIDSIVGNESGWFATYIADRAATLDGRGNPYGRAQSLADAKKTLVRSGMTIGQIETTLSRIPDPVLKGKSLLDRPGIKDEMAIAVSNREQNKLLVQKRQENQQFMEKFEPFAEAYAAAEAAQPGSGREMLMQFNRDTASLLYADRSPLNRLTRGLNDPNARSEALKRLVIMRESGEQITREMLDAGPSLNYSDYRYYLGLGKQQKDQRLGRENH